MSQLIQGFNETVVVKIMRYSVVKVAYIPLITYAAAARVGFPRVAGAAEEL
jgi:hypothetical protein